MFDEEMDYGNNSLPLEHMHCGLLSHLLDCTLMIVPAVGLVLNSWLLLTCLKFLRNRLSDGGRRRPHYALNCFILNGVIASLMAGCIQVARGVAGTFFDQEIMLLLIPADRLNDVGYKRLLVALMLMSTLFGPYAVAHFNYLLLLNVEKLFYILKPLHYDVLVNRKSRVLAACLCIWVFSFIWLPILYISPNLYEQAFSAETIFIAFLFLCPTGFGLITTTVIIVTVMKIKRRDRRLLLICERQQSTGSSSARAHVCETLTSSWRSFRGLIWAVVFSLPNPVVHAVLYYSADDYEQYLNSLNDCATSTLVLLVVNLSVAYLVGIAAIIVCTHAPYRRKALLTLRAVRRRLICDRDQRQKISLQSSKHSSDDLY